MIAVMSPFSNGQKADFRPAQNYGFPPPFEVPFLADFRGDDFEDFWIGLGER